MGECALASSSRRQTPKKSMIGRFARTTSAPTSSSSLSPTSYTNAASSIATKASVPDARRGELRTAPAASPSLRVLDRASSHAMTAWSPPKEGRCSPPSLCTPWALSIGLIKGYDWPLPRIVSCLFHTNNLDVQSNRGLLGFTRVTPSRLATHSRFYVFGPKLAHIYFVPE